jgi:hypothetical protein
MSPFQIRVRATDSEKVGEAESQMEEKSEVDVEEHEDEVSDSSLSSVDSFL